MNPILLALLIYSGTQFAWHKWIDPPVVKVAAVYKHGSCEEVKEVKKWNQ